MRLRNIKNKDLIIEKCPFLVANPENYLGKYQELFGNSNPIHLEIGMGKGKFIYEMALMFPQINFIGMEKYSGVMARAITNMKEPLDNLKIICYDAINIDKIFNHEIETIYLNFSDPWPKKRHHRRRLSSVDFLKKYDQIFVNEKTILMKTDNIALFEDSIVSLSNYGYIFSVLSLDLASSDIFNIKTEYEEKFSKLGFKINYLKATKK